MFGILIGIVVGIMKAEIFVWLGVGAAEGFLIGLLMESRIKKIKPEKLMWIGFFLLFPIMFFDDYLKGSFWFDVFGILALIGAFILIFNFTRVLKKRKKK